MEFRTILEDNLGKENSLEAVIRRKEVQPHLQVHLWDNTDTIWEGSRKSSSLRVAPVFLNLALLRFEAWEFFTVGAALGIAGSLAASLASIH